ncbi:hypothetical protein FRC12_001272 [Ceratobasidium sp. 428]|nr:hypothetical protein FRC12_001272 [Ceratobasidium sp. 428]
MDRILEHGKLFVCTVCPGKDGQLHTPMVKYQMAIHVNGPQHQKRLQNAELRDIETNRAGVFTQHILQGQEPATDSSESVLATEPAPTSSEPCLPPPPILLPSGDWSFSPPAPAYDFFQDSAYEAIGSEDQVCEFPVDKFGFPLPTSSAPRATAKSSSSRPNPYDDTSRWSPYSSKELFLTYNLFHAPAIQFSEAQQSAILDWATEMGAENVPSMYDLDQCGKKITSLMGEPTRMFKTDSGHIFYVNKVDAMLKQDFSNLSVRQHLEFYPDDCDGHVSEIWHGDKMTLGENREQLTPMASYGGRSFFINEISLLNDGTFFLTDMFLKRHGELHARGRKLEAHAEIGRMGLGGFCLSGTPVDYPLSCFQQNCVKLKDLNPDGIILRSGDTESHEHFAPHPLRAKANGREVYSVPFVVFVDDVSGNTSKQWNKHWCCYGSNASLPREKLNERINIRFMSTSQHASPIEILGGICQVFDEAFDEPVVVWDALTGREVLVRPYIHFISGDNPMHAEECSSSGLRSNFFCRTCGVGGTQVYKASEEGFSRQMELGAPRRPNDTIERIKYQYEIAFTTKSVELLREEQRNSGVKDVIAQPYLETIIKRRQELQKTTALSLPAITQKLREEFSTLSLEPRMNPLLSHRWLNVHLDTPTEILHTILLGAAKYLWTESIRQMDKTHTFSLFESRLRSVSVAGLNNGGPVSGYITKHRGSLNGKHFKTLLQTAPFCLHNIVETDLIHAWIALGRLTVLAWSASIEDIENYIYELQATITDFLHTIAKCVPALLVQKTKTHLLIHMPMFVRRFGPLLGPNSERYESFNASFRAASIHSNRQAPSRDIAHTFAVFDVVKHIMLGGYWLDSETNQRVRAGAGVIELCESSNFTRRLLGIKKLNTTPGAIFTKRNSDRGPWEQLVLEVQCPNTISPGSIVQHASNILAQNGDRVTSGCNVAYTHEGDANIVLGQICSILTQSEQSVAFVVLKSYQWMGEDVSVHMPAVSLTENSHVVTSSAIICKVNLQHRCAEAGCTDAGVEAIRQERQDSGSTRPAIVHNDNTRFIVNTLALHNSAATQKLTRVWSSVPTPFQPPANHASICKAAAASLARKKAAKAHDSDTAQSAQPAQPAQKPKASTQKAVKSAGPANTTQSTHAGPSTAKRRRLDSTVATRAGPSAAADPHAISAAAAAPLETAEPLVPAYVPPVLMNVQPPEQQGTPDTPDAWCTIWSTEYQRYYYYNSSTGETSWNNPYHVRA